MDVDQVVLVTTDNEEFVVDDKLIYFSQTLKSLFENVDKNSSDKKISLPNITGEIMKSIIKWCQYHYDHEDELNLFSGITENGYWNISPWNQQFFQTEIEKIILIYLAADHLHIQPLLDVTAKVFVNRGRFKTPDEIREEFSILDDLTEKQKKEIEQNENNWCLIHPEDLPKL